MKKIYVWMMLGGVMLAGCHRSHKQPADTVPAAPTEPADTAPLLSADSSAATTSPRGAAHLQLDTAETTHLHLWARKQKRIYDARLMFGEWMNGASRMQLDSGGTGRSWDTSDDIMRDEAKTFTWSVDSNLLSIVYKLALGGVVPKMYLVTFVDEESLVYRDDYGMSYMWDRPPTADQDRLSAPIPPTEVSQ